MLSLRVLNEIIEKNRAWILVLWCWFVWKIFGGHLGQKTKLLKRFMHESPQRNYWKESCMNLSFVMLIFLEDFWRAFGIKNKIVEKIHAWIPTIPLMLRFSNTLDLRCHFAWWQYCTACALESCWWSYWEFDGLANPWLKIETYWRKSK